MIFLNNYHFNGVVSSSEQKTTDVFSSYFSSVYSNSIVPFIACNAGTNTDELPNEVDFSVDHMYQGVFVLRGVFSIGPNGLSGDFIFQFLSVILYSLWVLFRHSLDQGIFPSMLNFSSVTPIFKSANSSIISNYRPISILSHISKLFELLVLYGIQPFMNRVLRIRVILHLAAPL